MTSPIDNIRRAARLRRAAPAERQRPDKQAEPAGLPAPIDAATAVPPEDGGSKGGAAAFDAQLLGQNGQKRGLRAGPVAIDSAAASYNRIEWSGTKDRRARAGRITKTEI